MPREILVDWTTPAGSDKVSVFYFIEATSVASQRAALGTFLGTIDANISNQVSWTIRTQGREMLSATGALTGSWTEGTAQTGTGALAQEPVADATQVLVRWLTDQIVGSRFLQGRTFIPGLGTNGIDSGNMLEATRLLWQAAATTLIGAAVQLGVWHRPVLGAGGVMWAADVASVNSELAVLRRRRG